MTTKKRRVPVRSLDELVAHASPIHGERRAERARLVATIGAALKLYEARTRITEEAADALTAAIAALEDARARERWWAAAIDDLAKKLGALDTEAQAEHRNMFRTTTMVRSSSFDPETGEVFDDDLTFRRKE